MIYFISDTHFGHKNILKLCNRPFESIEEMDETIIKNWNDRVDGSDTVYIIGDMFFRSNNAEKILQRLKGKKRLIIGNHDGSWMTKFDATKYFASIDNYLEVSIDNHLVVMCHYPLLTWKHQKKSYMIHGHIHSDTQTDFWPLIAVRDNVLNAGVDINGFTPVSLSELIENNKNYKAVYKNEI